MRWLSLLAAGKIHLFMSCPPLAQTQTKLLNKLHIVFLFHRHTTPAQVHDLQEIQPIYIYEPFSITYADFARGPFWPFSITRRFR